VADFGVLAGSAGGKQSQRGESDCCGNKRRQSEHGEEASDPFVRLRALDNRSLVDKPVSTLTGIDETRFSQRRRDGRARMLFSTGRDIHPPLFSLSSEPLHPLPPGIDDPTSSLRTVADALCAQHRSGKGENAVSNKQVNGARVVIGAILWRWRFVRSPRG
jgi:hypothetical protein